MQYSSPRLLAARFLLPCKGLMTIFCLISAVNSMKPTMDQSNCILVQDIKSITQSQHQITATPEIPTEESLPTSITTQTTHNNNLNHTTAQHLQASEVSIPELPDLNHPIHAKIASYSFWNTEFRNKQPNFLNLNLTLPWGANFAVYGRRNVAASVTQYDFVEFVRGGRLLKRDLENLKVNVSLLQYLDTGRWFLSIYNDEMQENEVDFVLSEAEGISTTCLNDCSGRGSCYLGKCDCIDGFQGTDCSKSVCPILCSGHGQYGGGVCHCEDGWKGAECDIPISDCLSPHCTGHGTCKSGSCVCRPGWKGPTCSEPDCIDPTCSNHGSCVDNKCYCKAGWIGAQCHEIDQRIHACLPGCSDHGAYDLETAKCICDKHFTGVDCSEPICTLDCGGNGKCDQGKCKCDVGWTGAHCELRPCDPRCSEHGQCKNGTCVCSQGWNGRHCTLRKLKILIIVRVAWPKPSK